MCVYMYVCVSHEFWAWLVCCVCQKKDLDHSGCDSCQPNEACFAVWDMMGASNRYR